MSPRTSYDIQAVSSDFVYLGTPSTPGAMPILMVMGIAVKEVTWLPDGIAVVTDTFEDDLPRWKDWFVPVSKWTTGTSTTPLTTTGVSDWRETVEDLSPYKRYFDTGSVFSTTAVASGVGDTTFTWKPDGTYKLMLAHEKVPAKAKIHEWDDPVTESQEPDPESIYGRALARARAETSKKK